MLSSVNSPYWLVSAATLHTTTRLKACTGRCLLRVKISCRDCRGEASAGPQKAAELVRCSAFVGLDGALSQGSTASGALSGRSITDGQCDAAGDRRTRDASRSPSHLNVRRSELAAAPSTPSIEAPLDEHVDVFTLSHWCRAGMPRRMVDQVGLIIGRTNDPKPAHAQLCGRVARARKALLYRRASDFPARRGRFPNITQEHWTILPHELLAASQPHSAWHCGTLSATFAA